MAVSMHKQRRRIRRGMPAVMGGRGRKRQADGEKKGGAKAGQEAEPTR